MLEMVGTGAFWSDPSKMVGHMDDDDPFHLIKTHR